MWKIVQKGAVLAVSIGIFSLGTGVGLGSTSNVSATLKPSFEPMGANGIVNSTLVGKEQALSSTNYLQTSELTAKVGTTNPQIIIQPHTDCQLTPAYFHNSSHRPGTIGIQWTVGCGGAVQSSISINTYLYLRYCNFFYCVYELLDARSYTKTNMSEVSLGAYGACVTGRTDSYYSTATATYVGDGVTVTLNNSSGPTDVTCQPR